MSRTLLLMRHAEAEAGFGVDDAERSLTDRGRSQAETVGRMLAAQGYTPDHVLCSSARRTRQTLDGVLGTLEPRTRPEIDISEAVYSAGTDTLLELITYVPAEAETVLVVAHNPTVAQLASDFLGHPGMGGYPPATVTAVALEVEWLYAAPGTGAGVVLN
ncbi:histidine phosphatase family protein [Nocardiopsis sp. HNM0947]|uniref:Histidine phosphatase family protein n=1 Tax=Nocardiopsis coralli TaxID=2772213 RepID=A0ABR9PDE7_9ACTN|nr:histidine phosphatase family protein [Nocardiopsis coralli]MBE3001859.1 histidine phosphatase family protein [Nocardiopsis coralli]